MFVIACQKDMGLFAYGREGGERFEIIDVKGHHEVIVLKVYPI